MILLRPLPILSQCTSLTLTAPHLPTSFCLSVPVSLSVGHTVAVCLLSFCLFPTQHTSCFLFLSMNLSIDCLLHLLFCFTAPLTSLPLVSLSASLFTADLSASLVPMSPGLVVPPCHSLFHCLDYLGLPALGSLPISLYFYFSCPLCL